MEDEIINFFDLFPDMFITGADTTSSALNYVLVHLLNVPFWKEKFFHEIITALQGGVPSMGDLEKLLKLDAFIQETLSPNPNAPLIPKATVGDYVGPACSANCHVWVILYHIIYDPITFPDLLSSLLVSPRWHHIQTQVSAANATD